ncbi:MAG: sigma 54-interacting transcriptional regulator [Desulfobacterales bacterium]|nr:sigma 54-interacting transcriptional regulator [Desulfobacterales bacterium]
MEQRLTYQQIFEATSNGAVATDAHGRIAFMNPQAEEILGFDAAKSRGMFIVDLLPLTGPLVMACLTSGAPQLGRHIIGKQVDLVVNITAIVVADRICGAVCNFQEMGQFEQAARQLESYRHLNCQLETIFTASSDGIWVCDAAGVVINVNEASERLNGIEAKDVIGENIGVLLQKGLFDRSVTVEVLETRRQVSVMQYIQKTGRHLLSTGTPVFDEKGNISLVVVNERDMTQLNAIREQLDQSHMETEKIRDELAELSMLELKNQEIVAEGETMRQILRAALKLGNIGASNILILGESGTGKGLLSKFIHKSSRRSKMPFIQINCAALPESLLEAELFGYERGAFTGAREKGKIGLFELAHKGTLFLDEIGDMPLSLQAKLLKYLDDQEIMRLGGITSKKIDCTIIAATNKDLEAEVRRRSFRQDLYYRLNTFTLRIPPLRQRPEDIFELVNHYLGKYNQAYGLKKHLLPEGLEMLCAYDFPGNVRELKNLVKKAVVMGEQRCLDDFISRSLRVSSAATPLSNHRAGSVRSLTDEIDALERDMLQNALRPGRTTRDVASELKISQSSVVRKLRKHGLRPSS